MNGYLEEAEGKNVRIIELDNGRYRYLERKEILEIVRRLATVCEEVHIKIKNNDLINVSAYGCEVDRKNPKWWEEK